MHYWNKIVIEAERRKGMIFKYSIPTTVYYGSHCIDEQAQAFETLGHKAMIVTGKYSARLSGALDEVIQVLSRYDQEYIIFDQVENNPSIETVEKASRIAKNNGVNYIIGIGGGSPIDAAKAIAVLAANSEMKAIELFKNDFDRVLPIVGIPTTAGTGSEVTPYSVLLRNDLQTKVSFGNIKTFPTYAFLDGRYTESLTYNTTVNTAIDALTHVMEGYVAKRSTPITDALALEAISVFHQSMSALSTGKITLEDRERLMYVSLLGGMVIAQAGVTLAHGMGYCYTFFKDMPHGKANGLIMKGYFSYLAVHAPQKVAQILQRLGYKEVVEFTDWLEQLFGKAPQLTSEEIEQYTALTLLQKGSMANTPGEATQEIVHHLWETIN